VITDTVSWTWLYRRCVLWGLATGAGAGAGFGALVGAGYFETVGGAAVGALTGAVFAIPIALIPSLLGAAVVAEAIYRRQDLRRSLGVGFAAVAAVVNAAWLIGIALWGDAAGAAYLLAGDAGALPMLWWGWASITRTARAGS
jgi:hypothetical protein